MDPRAEHFRVCGCTQTTLGENCMKIHAYLTHTHLCVDPTVFHTAQFARSCRSWTTQTGTVFKDDFFRYESLSPSANSAVWNIVGSTYRCVCLVGMSVNAVVSQFHLCKPTETKLFSSGTVFKADFSCYESLSPSANSAVWHTVGSTYRCVC